MKKALPLIVSLLIIGVGVLVYLGISRIQEADIEPTRINDPRVVVDEEPAEPAAQTARYRVVFNATWSADTHPDTLPENPHMSPGVLAYHSSEEGLFKLGTGSPLGLQEMAETGRTGIITAELEAAGIKYELGSRIDVPGENTFEVELTQEDSFLSFVSMLAPSPDWFIGLDSVALFEFGQWVDSFEDINLTAYDVGTDSGVSFSSENLATSPRGLVDLPVDPDFIAASRSSFGSISIQRLEN